MIRMISLVFLLIAAVPAQAATLRIALDNVLSHRIVAFGPMPTNPAPWQLGLVEIESQWGPALVEATPDQLGPFDLLVDTDTSVVLEGPARLFSLDIEAVALDYTDEYDFSGIDTDVPEEPIIDYDTLPLIPKPLRQEFLIALGTNLGAFGRGRYGNFTGPHVLITFGADGIDGVLGLAPGESRVYDARWYEPGYDEFFELLSPVPGSSLTITKLGGDPPDGSTTAVPLPATGWLLLGAAAGLGALRRRAGS